MSTYSTRKHTSLPRTWEVIRDEDGATVETTSTLRAAVSAAQVHAATVEHSPEEVAAENTGENGAAFTVEPGPGLRAALEAEAAEATVQAAVVEHERLEAQVAAAEDDRAHRVAVELAEAHVTGAQAALAEARDQVARAKAHLAEVRRAGKPATAARGASDGPKKVVEIGEVIQHSTARETGTATAVHRVEAGWVMTCEAHGTTAERRNRLVAEAEARKPSQWCPACARS